MHQTAFFSLTWGNVVSDRGCMCFPLSCNQTRIRASAFVPIAFGMLLVNIYPDIMLHAEDAANGTGGLLYYFYKLDEWSILPSPDLHGCRSDDRLGPLIANPKSFLLVQLLSSVFCSIPWSDGYGIL